MGIELESGGGGAKRIKPQMNITPLVDVVLVLLIIFMVVTPLLTKQLWLNVPPRVEEEQPPPPPGALPPLVLTLEADGATKVNGERIERYYGRMQAESRRALYDMSFWGLPQLWRMARVDALVLGAEHDALIAPSIAQSAAHLLGAAYRRLDGVGHAIMLEPAWESAAQVIVDWLDGRRL